MSKRIRSILVVSALITAVIAGYYFRSWFANDIMPPSRRMQTETTQSYRYARMISEDGCIPRLDTLVMYPGGMSTSENSIFEEYIAGGIHRVTGGDFDLFIRLFSLLFPLLTIPLLYLWMRAADYGVSSALAGSTLYAFIFPALLRARGESFYRETVALPFLVALAWLVEKAISNGERDGQRSRKTLLTSISAGLILIIALAAWKVSAFITLFLFLYLYWRNYRRGDIPFSLRLSLAAAQLLAALLLSHMRHDGALISPSSVMAVLLVLKRPKSIWIPVAGTLLALLSAFTGTGSAGHVSAVIVAKIRFMFSHPSNPQLLSDDARLFWVPGYTTPTPAQFLLLFGIPIAAAIPGVRQFFREKNGKLIFWFLFLSLAGYLFFDRLLVLPAIALIPVIAISFRKKWFIIPAMSLILLQSVFPGYISEMISRTGLRYRNTSSFLNDTELDSFLQWVRLETDSDEAVLSFWHISGLLSAYADRPVVTHTFFENSDNRNTIVEFARSMFMTEESLTAFMLERKCSLIVYQADFLLDCSYSGLLYLAGLQEVPDYSVAWKMHYAPELLSYLTPVFQGPSLRVFRIGALNHETLPRQFLFEERYRHCYDGYDSARDLMFDQRAASGYLADRAMETMDPDMLSGAILLGVSGGGPERVLEQMLNDLIQLYIQGSYTLDHLAEDIETFIYWFGSRTELRLLLARLYASESMFTNAELQYLLVLEEDPGNIQASDELHLLTDRGTE
ncbi:hypothetical protein DRQ25_03650 [Candidatus Fermentibacteria bacterium]|nr:MAG: hypothetical protein DRQ25_03650 [Candidatus Fermentibacteria bacterium]